MQKITPFLWFDDQAEQAAAFYTSVFERSAIVDVMHYGEAGPGEKGSVMSVTFELDGQTFIALNGGPNFRFTEAVSFMVMTEDQAETDRLWDALLADGGSENACGWLKDRWGLSWQITPRRLMELTTDPNPARAKAAMQAMMGMVKMDLAALEAAARE